MRPLTCGSGRAPNAFVVLTVRYPELIQCYKINNTNDNRSWCRERNIGMTTLPKVPIPKLSVYEKRKQRDEYSERNHSEGRIGNAKRSLSLNQIKPKLLGTSETWFAATLNG